MQIVSIVSAALSIAMVAVRFIRGAANLGKSIRTKSKTPPSQIAYQVVETSLNIYREPSLASEVVGQVSAGDIVMIDINIGQQAERMIWRQVENGWIPEKIADSSLVFIERI